MIITNRALVRLKLQLTLFIRTPMTFSVLNYTYFGSFWWVFINKFQHTLQWKKYF